MSDAFMEQNKNIKHTYQVFGKVYDIFEALDKDYIQRILVNVEAAKEANNKAQKGLNETKDLFDSQKTIISKLKKHKEELDTLQHLKEIDEFYNAYRNFEIYQEKHISDLKLEQEVINTNVAELNNQQNELNEWLYDFKELYDGYTELQNQKNSYLTNNQDVIAAELKDFQNQYSNFTETHIQNDLAVTLKQDSIQNELNLFKKHRLELDLIQEQKLKAYSSEQTEVHNVLNTLREEYDMFVKQTGVITNEFRMKQDKLTNSIRYLTIFLSITIIMFLVLSVLVISGVL